MAGDSSSNHRVTRKKRRNSKSADGDGPVRAQSPSTYIFIRRPSVPKPNSIVVAVGRDGEVYAHRIA